MFPLSIEVIKVLLLVDRADERELSLAEQLLLLLVLLPTHLLAYKRGVVDSDGIQ